MEFSRDSESTDSTLDLQIDCAQKCTFAEECGGVKVKGTGDNGNVVCQLYKESDGVNQGFWK